MFFLLTAVQKLSKSNEFFQSYDDKCTVTFFYESQCIAIMLLLIKIS